VRSILRRATLLGAALVCVGFGRAAAHGTVLVGPPDALAFAVDWSIEPLVAIPLIVLALAWSSAIRRVNRAHPANQVPRIRSAAFYGGLAAIAVALMSGIERYDTILFSVHMVQHILLTLVAAPLLVMSGPITLLLRLSSPEVRHRWILPVLHSRIVRSVSFPVVAWVLFAAVMWGTHFSPVFDAALENPLVHDLEHLAYLVTALLFWWPAVGVDPSPWRMSHPVRVLYVFLQMPQNTFLAVVLLNLDKVLYPHYATLVRSWGPSALDDQRAAAGIMWLAGDTIFLAAILAIVVGWMRAEAHDAGRIDRRAAVELTEIRVRERALAERLAREREDGQPGSGAAR
jgi:cytochrome c oxidase assembly factor CtaG